MAAVTTLSNELRMQRILLNASIETLESARALLSMSPGNEHIVISLARHIAELRTELDRQL
jgi:hypothetical protein